MTESFNRTDTAKLLGITPPTLDRWVAEGLPAVVRGSKGVQWVFSMPEVIQWYAQRYSDKNSRQAPVGEDGEALSLEEINRRTALARMLQAELDLEKAREGVALVEEFQIAWARMFAEIQTNMLNVVQRAAQQLIGEKDETTFKRILKEEISIALAQAAKADVGDPEDEEGMSFDDYPDDE